MAIAAPPFTGFRPEAVQFLADLAANNERAWFQPRKAEFERLLKQPLEALIAALADRFAERGIPLRADPARAPFRIYRDVRFSKDKSPYKTNIGASFPWAADDAEPGPDHGRSEIANVHSGGGYFHLSPGEIYVGGGIWHPEKPWLDAFRQRVVDEPATLRRALSGRPALASLATKQRIGDLGRRLGEDLVAGGDSALWRLLSADLLEERS